MRITQLRVDHFDAWDDLTLPVADHGLTLVYGPNEAGKSTLMRFLRGVLYGYEDDYFGDSRALSDDRFGTSVRFDAATSRDRWSDASGIRRGSVEVLHERRAYTLQRVAEAGGAGRLSIHPQPPHCSEAEFLADLLCGTEQSLFQSVFAIGLAELNELSMLQSEDVAQYIYNLSLGHEGKRLGDLLIDLPEDSAPPAHVTRLRVREADLTDELHRLSHARDRFDALLAERRRVTDERRDVERRISRLEEATTRCEKLATLKPHHDRVLKLQRESGVAPQAAPLSADYLRRYDQLEAELEAARERRTKLQNEARRLREQAARTETKVSVPTQTSVAQEDPVRNAMRAFVAQRDFVGQIEQRRMQSARDAQKREQEYLGVRQSLEGVLSPAAVSALESESSAPVETASLPTLLKAAGRYRSAIRSRDQLRKKYDRESDKYNRKSAELNQHLTRLEVGSVPEAIDASRARVGDLHDLARLFLRSEELDARAVRLQEDVRQIDLDTPIPAWVHLVLTGFILVGSVVAIAGWYRGVDASFWAGVLYAFIGLTGTGLMWGLRSWLDSDNETALLERIEEQRELAIRLRAHDEEIDAVMDRLGLYDEEGNYEVNPDIAAYLASETDALTTLYRLQSRDAALTSLRKRLSLYRRTHQEKQRKVHAARQAWCELCVRLGLPESSKTAPAFDQWDGIVKLHRSREAFMLARGEAERWDGLHAQLRGRLESLGRSAGEREVAYDNPIQTLDRWKSLVGQAPQVTQKTDVRHVETTVASDADPLWHDATEKWDRADELSERIDELTTLIVDLLEECECGSREQMEARVHQTPVAHASSEELRRAEAEYRQARERTADPVPTDADLQGVTKSHLEAELIRFSKERQEAETALARLDEQWRRLESEHASLASDESDTRLRQERDRVRTEINEELEAWWAAKLSRQALLDAQSQYEAYEQPGVLDAAGRYLSRMTCGQFDSLWADPDRQAIGVSDLRGRSLSVGQLSEGTREQVFLALRLALVDQFAADGVDLPVVLDDVLVNFDRHRTEAVIDTLIEFAEQGRQVILLTCHEHLTGLVSKKGHHVVTLPGRRTQTTDRLPAPRVEVGYRTTSEPKYAPESLRTRD